MHRCCLTPGERWEYGIGIDWVGKIVEAVSGEALEDYLQAHLFSPLGMTDTSFLLRSDMQQRLVAASARDADGFQSIEFDFPSDGDFHMGGGGLYSTGPDYLRFTRMLLGGGMLDGVRVLEEKTVALMGENAIGDIEVPPLGQRQSSRCAGSRSIPRPDQTLGTFVHAQHRGRSWLQSGQ